MVVNKTIETVYGGIRVITIAKEDYYIANDVAKALGYSNPSQAIKRYVNEENKIIRNVVEVTRERKNNYRMILINQRGVNELIYLSNAKNTNVFKKYIDKSLKVL